MGEVIPPKEKMIESKQDVKIEEENSDDEDYLLGGRPPLVTILTLSVGPLVSQIVAAMTSVIGSIIVASTIGQTGVEVYGAVFTVEFVAIAVAQFLNAGISVRLSYLYGARETENCDQMFVDFLRLSVVFGAIVPAIVFPILKPVIMWFGASQELADMCFEYMFPITAGSIFNIIFLISCGVVQADGKSTVYAVVQIASFVLNVGIFAPLFLKGLKTPIWGASLATMLSQAIPGFVITVLVFKGKFRITPKLNMFIKAFSPETKNALRIGLSTLISNVSLTLPFILMQKYVNLAAEAINQYNNAVAVWAVVEKLYLVVGGINIGFSQGFLNPASYAFGRRDMRRFVRLMIHSLWLCTLTSLIISIIIICLVMPISMLWSTDPSFLEMSRLCTPILYYTAFALGVHYVIPVALQAMNKVLASSILSVITLVLPVPIFSTILYFTGDGHSNPQRIFYTYTIGDMWSLTCCLVFFYKPFRQIIHAIRHPDENVFPYTSDEEMEDTESKEHDMDKQERQADEL